MPSHSPIATVLTLPGPVLTTLITVGVGFAGVVVGAVLNPWLTARLRERDRALELYKLLLPSMTAAAQRLMEEAEGVLSKASSLDSSFAQAEEMVRAREFRLKYTHTDDKSRLDEQERWEERATRRRQRRDDEHMEVWMATDALYSTAVAAEWVLGHEVREAVGKFIGDCRRAAGAVILEQPHSRDYDDSYGALVATVRRRLRMDHIESQFGVHSPKGERTAAYEPDPAALSGDLRRTPP